MEKKKGLGWGFISSLVDVISIALISVIVMVVITLIMNLAVYQIVAEYKVYANFLCYILMSLLYLAITQATKLNGTIGNFLAAKILG